MKQPSTWTRGCGMMLLLATGGCAAAYHDYPCGCVPYDYCAPPPLGYTAYESCPGPVAACFFRNASPSISERETPTSVPPGVAFGGEVLSQ